MHLPDFDYVRPGSLGEALGLLARHGPQAVALAGGTDLLVSMRQRLVVPGLVVAIGALPELRHVAVTADGGLAIGAGCTLAGLVRHPQVRSRYPSLVAAMQSVGSLHVRNVATLGGNLNLPTRCWYTNQGEEWRQARPPCLKTQGEVCHVIPGARECFAINSADSAVALLTLGARLRLASAAGEREVPVADFYRNDGLQPTRLAPGELVTAVHLPAPRGRALFLKIAQRTGLDYGLGTIAVAVTGSNRRPSSVRLAVGSVASWPVALAAAGQAIESGGFTDEAIEAAAAAARADLGAITGLYSPAGYKRRLVRALVRRALADVRRRKPVVREAA